MHVYDSKFFNFTSFLLFKQLQLKEKYLENAQRVSKKVNLCAMTRETTELGAARRKTVDTHDTVNKLIAQATDKRFINTHTPSWHPWL